MPRMGVSRRPFAVLFVAALAVYSGVWMYYVRAQNDGPIAPFDYRYDVDTNELIVTSVRPRSQGARAGLVRDDRVVGIDGGPIRSYRQVIDLFGRSEPGTGVQLTIRHEGQTRTAPITLEERGKIMEARIGKSSSLMALDVILTFYPVLFLVVGAGVLLQRPDDPNAWAMALAFGGLIAVAPLVALEPVMHPALRPFMLAVWALLSALMPASFYFLFAVFPQRSPIDRRVPWLKYALGVIPGLGGGALAIACAMSGTAEPLAWIAARVPMSPLGTIAFAYTVGGIGLAVLSLVTNAFGPIETRRKTRVILAGTVLGLAPLLSLVAYSAFHDGRRVPFPLWAVAALALSFIPLSVAYAVVKHRVMELPVLLRRSARYLLVRRGAVTIAVLLGTVTTLVLANLLAQVFGSVEGASSLTVAAGSVFGGALAFVGQRLWRPAGERIDRAFFRGAYDARRLLEQLATDTRAATSRAALAQTIERSVDEAVHPISTRVFLREETDHFVSHATAAGTATTVALPADLPGLAELALHPAPLTLAPEEMAEGQPWHALLPFWPEVLVPMVGRASQLEGLLLLGPRLADEPYSGEDRALLRSVAAQAGLALESIRLAESMATRLEAERRQAHELEIAKDVQAMLLPQHAPAVPTLDYAGRCVQARQVGGDFFDFVRIGKTQLGLVLADISGKGMSAALLMASLQASLRGQFAQAPTDLAQVVAAVSRTFFESTAANHYATLFIAVYDETTGSLHYANCGHLPPILLRAGGQVERLAPTGPVIGLFERWVGEGANTRLSSGDRLIVFSDGVTEAQGAAGDEFGDERLLALVGPAWSSAVAELDAVLAALAAHSGGGQFDDITLILVRRI